MTDSEIKLKNDYVESAEFIINSSRWKNIEKYLNSLNVSSLLTPQEEIVFFEIFNGLGSEYHCLKYDYYENKFTSLSLLAWRARNLLELNTWIRFCCEDKANPTLFFFDAGKDQLDLEEKMQLWGKETDQPTEFFEQIERNKKNIKEQAEKYGITNLNSKYKSLSAASKMLKHHKTFHIHNKILSKFAHPTAMRLFTQRSKKEVADIAFYFFSQGCLFFYDGFSRIEKCIDGNKK